MNYKNIKCIACDQSHKMMWPICGECRDDFQLWQAHKRNAERMAARQHAIWRIAKPIAIVLATVLAGWAALIVWFL